MFAQLDDAACVTSSSDGGNRSVDQIISLRQVLGVVLALRFQDSVDPTAIATLLLALATVFLAIFARHALKASQREITELHNQGERAHQPVMIPVFDHGRMDLGPRGTTERMPKVTDGTTLLVPTENIGAGPALKLYAKAELRPHSDTSVNATDRVVRTKLMGVAKTSFLLLEFDVDRWPADPAFTLVLDYKDLAGSGWKTEGEWDPGSKRWTNVDVKKVPEGPAATRPPRDGESPTATGRARP